MIRTYHLIKIGVFTLIITTIASASDETTPRAVAKAVGEAVVEVMTPPDVKQVPLLNRPYRVGHVYGNTVRRRHKSGRPLWLHQN